MGTTRNFGEIEKGKELQNFLFKHSGKGVKNFCLDTEDVRFSCFLTSMFLIPVLQSGGECIRAYASMSLDQVAQWRDEQGMAMLWYCFVVENCRDHSNNMKLCLTLLQ